MEVTHNSKLYKIMIDISVSKSMLCEILKKIPIFLTVPVTLATVE